jgi:hypothetical protein
MARGRDPAAKWEGDQHLTLVKWEGLVAWRTGMKIGEVSGRQRMGSTDDRRRRLAIWEEVGVLRGEGKESKRLGLSRAARK